jgi:hypothetical protein
MVAEKTNVGVVPPVNFKFERRLGTRATLQLERDALAAPQGRADTEEIYTLALAHYLAAGVVGRFRSPGGALSGRRAPGTSCAVRSADSIASSCSRIPPKRAASAPVCESAGTGSSRFAASRLLITIAMNRLMTTKTASTTKLT